MRWKIETTESNYSDKQSDYELTNKNTKTEKTLYISVGDIVGMGKTAAGAVQKLAKQLPVFINKMKSLASSDEKASKSAATATGINSIVQPLSVILNGMDKYRKIMNVVDRLTPIMKTIARTTGVWCSPGNVAELGQMAIGIANQILIGVISSSILNLKDKIWNYEFDIKTISSTTSIFIIKLLKKYDEENDDISISRTPISRNNPDGINKYNNTDQKINELINSSFDKKFENIKPDSELLLDKLKDNQFDDNKKGKYNYNDNNYVTEYKEGTSKYNRILFGSLDNGGILYSDDDRNTWKKSNITTGSFANFCKIKVGDNYVYIAGSTYPIKEVTPLEADEEIVMDSENRYTKDYYSLSAKRLSRKEKDKILKNNNRAYIKDAKLLNKSNVIEKENALGIYYSLDNGESWEKSTIKKGRFELFFEYKEKERIPTEDDASTSVPNRVVASSYDYEGVYYTDDGINWYKSKMLKNGSEEEIKTGRWIFYTDSDNELSNKILARKIKGIGYSQDTSVNSVVETSFKNANSISSMSPKCYSNIGQYNLDIIKPVLKYIHENYSDRLPKYTAEWWLKKISFINDGIYTIEDAKNDIGLTGTKEDFKK